MAIPLIAAGIAARVVGKKIATRVVAGITGAGARQVTSTYRNTSNLPKPPPGSKPFNSNPPKPPTSSSIPKKRPHVPEKWH